MPRHGTVLGSDPTGRRRLAAGARSAHHLLRGGARPQRARRTNTDASDAATESHLAQARLVGANPLPDQARRTTFPRANPYSEVTDRFCRLPLPTLVYTTRGSSPRRPDADMSTTWRETSRGPLPDFHGPRGRLRTPQQLRCSPRSAAYLPARGFQAATTLIQKRQLSPQHPPASPGLFGSPRRGLHQESRSRASAFDLNEGHESLERFRVQVAEWGPRPLSPVAVFIIKHNNNK